MGQTFKYPLDKLLFGYTSASIWLHLPWTSFYLVTPPLGQASIWLHLPWTSFYLVTPPLDKLLFGFGYTSLGQAYNIPANPPGRAFTHTPPPPPPPEHISRHLTGQRHHVSKHPPLAMTHTDRGVRSNFPVISTLVFSGTPPSPHQPIRE